MKKNIVITLALCSVLGTSCVELVQEPLSFMSPENIETNEKNSLGMLDGLYRELWGGNYEYNCRTVIMGLGADDIGTGNLTKRHTNFDQMDITVGNQDGDSQTMWSNMYGLAQAANLWMETFEGSTTIGETTKAQYIAECRFMRAFAYFNLVRWFGDVPCFIDSKCATDLNGSTTITRNKTEEIYTKIIIPDLEYAATNLPAYSRADNNSRVGAWAAKACLADVYMTMAGWPLKQTGKYTDAARICEDIIQNSGYDLMENYGDLWTEGNKSDRTEHMFALNHSKEQLASNYGKSYFIQEESGWADYTADPVFYENHPDDARKDFNFVATFRINNRNVPYTRTIMKAPAINKYRDYGGVGSAQSAGITPIYRFAEVLLMYAEAQCKSTGTPNQLAYECLDRVRYRAAKNKATHHAYTSEDDFTPEQFLQKVFDEYGYEFFAEFKRWFYLVRNEKVYEVNHGYIDAFGVERPANDRVKEAMDVARITQDNRKLYHFVLPARETQECGFEQNDRAW